MRLEFPRLFPLAHGLHVIFSSLSRTYVYFLHANSASLFSRQRVVKRIIWILYLGNKNASPLPPPSSGPSFPPSPAPPSPLPCPSFSPPLPLLIPLLPIPTAFVAYEETSGPTCENLYLFYFMFRWAISSLRSRQSFCIFDISLKTNRRERIFQRNFM